MIVSFLKKHIVLTLVLCCVVPCIQCMEEEGGEKSPPHGLVKSKLELNFARRRPSFERRGGSDPIGLTSPSSIERFFKKSLSNVDLVAAEQNSQARSGLLREMEEDEGQNLLARLEAVKQRRLRAEGRKSVSNVIPPANIPVKVKQ